jgi:hypothetical protein
MSDPLECLSGRRSTKLEFQQHSFHSRHVYFAASLI